MQLSMLGSEEYRTFIEGFKIDTSHVLADVIQTIHFSRREESFFTVQELMWVGCPVSSQPRG